MVKLINSRYENNRHIKRNFVINVLDGSLFAFGMNFVSLTTILPLLVKQMGGSNISIGLIPVVWALGFNFPQIFIANYARKQIMKKSLVMKTALFQRIPWLLMSVFAFFLFSRLSSGAALLLFFMGFGLAAVTGAINMPAWFALIFKVTPVELRGRLFALRLTLGALFGILAGGAAKIVLDSFSYPTGFSLLFLFAFLMMMISYIVLSQLKEERVSPPLNLVRYKEFLSGLPSILRYNKNFRNYLIGDSLMVCAGMAHAFFTVFAFDKFFLSPGYAGQFTIVMMMATILGSLFFGFLADKYGHRINLIFSAGFILTASILALTTNTIELYHFVFVFSALTLALIQVSRLNIIAELSSEDDRSTYVALTNLITVPFTFSGIFAGFVANKFGYEPVFIISSLFAMMALIWFKFMLTEPRKGELETII